MKTVLIVDDSAFMRRIMKKIVVKNGYKVVGEAKNGIEAISQYKKLRADIVTLDIVMPEMGGLEALEKLVKIDPQVSVVMVSSMGQDLIVHDAIVLGAKNFILKPFTEEQIMKAFKKVEKTN